MEDLSPLSDPGKEKTRPFPLRPLEEYLGGEKIEINTGSYGQVISSVAHPEYVVKFRVDATTTSFLREVALIKNLNHPNIIQLVDIAPTDYQYVVMKRMPFDLCDYLDAGLGLTPEKVGKQMIASVYYINTHHIWHRDLKLENFLYDPAEEHIWLIDYGLADNVNYLDTSFNYPAGYTLPYRSAEILMGSSAYHLSADVWALGLCLLYLYVPREEVFGSDKITHTVRMIQQVYRFLGNPIHVWPESQTLPKYLPISVSRQSRPLALFLEGRVPTEMKELILSMVAYLPLRISIQEVYQRTHGPPLLEIRAIEAEKALYPSGSRVDPLRRARLLYEGYLHYVQYSECLSSYFLAAYLLDRYLAFVQADESRDSEIMLICLLLASQMRNDLEGEYRDLLSAGHGEVLNWLVREVIQYDLDVVVSADYLLLSLEEDFRAVGLVLLMLVGLTDYPLQQMPFQVAVFVHQLVHFEVSPDLLSSVQAQLLWICSSLDLSGALEMGVDFQIYLRKYFSQP